MFQLSGRKFWYGAHCTDRVSVFKIVSLSAPHDGRRAINKFDCRAVFGRIFLKVSLLTGDMEFCSRCPVSVTMLLRLARAGGPDALAAPPIVVTLIPPALSSEQKVTGILHVLFVQGVSI